MLKLLSSYRGYIAAGCVVPFNRLGTAAFSLVNGPLNVHICEPTLQGDFKMSQNLEFINFNHSVISVSRYDVNNWYWEHPN
jgi:hypothetical protein